MGFYIVPGNNGEVPIFFTLPLSVFVRWDGCLLAMLALNANSL